MVGNPYRILPIPFRQDHLDEKRPGLPASRVFFEEPPQEIFGFRESTGPKQSTREAKAERKVTWG